MDTPSLKLFKRIALLFVSKRKLPTLFVIAFPRSFLAQILIHLLRLFRKYIVDILEVKWLTIPVCFRGVKIRINLTENVENYEEPLVYVLCGRNYELIPEFLLNNE